MGRKTKANMKSMTGFGKRESLCQGTMVGVEIRSVNHRFCEMMVRLPKSLSHMELGLKEQVKRICERGRIELTVTMNGGGSGDNKTVQVDRAMASRYVQGLRDLQREFKLGGTVDVNVVAGFRDLFSTSEEPTVIKDVPKVVEGLVQRALTDLEKMRKKEGTALQKDLLQRVQTVEERLHVVQQRIPSALQVSADRLKARVAKLLEGERVNNDRIAQEIAMFAEHAEVYGRLYGTPWKELEQESGSNTDILLDIDVQGARQVMKNLQKAVTIFILPPSLEVLRTRLVERATDTSDEQERRFQKSQEEMRSYSEYQYTIRNETLEQAIEELQGVIMAERVRTTHIDAAHVFR